MGETTLTWFSRVCREAGAWTHAAVWAEIPTFPVWVSPDGFPGNFQDKVIYLISTRLFRPNPPLKFLGVFYGLVNVSSVRSSNIYVLFKKTNPKKIDFCGSRGVFHTILISLAVCLICSVPPEGGVLSDLSGEPVFNGSLNLFVLILPVILSDGVKVSTLNFQSLIWLVCAARSSPLPTGRSSRQTFFCLVEAPQGLLTSARSAEF